MFYALSIFTGKTPPSSSAIKRAYSQIFLSPLPKRGYAINARTEIANGEHVLYQFSGEKSRFNVQDYVYIVLSGGV